MSSCTPSFPIVSLRYAAAAATSSGVTLPSRSLYIREQNGEFISTQPDLIYLLSTQNVYCFYITCQGVASGCQSWHQHHLSPAPVFAAWNQPENVPQ